MLSNPRNRNYIAIVNIYLIYINYFCYNLTNFFKIFLSSIFSRFVIFLPFSLIYLTFIFFFSHYIYFSSSRETRRIMEYHNLFISLVYHKAGLQQKLWQLLNYFNLEAQNLFTLFEIFSFKSEAIF